MRIMFLTVFLMPLCFAGAGRAFLGNKNDVEQWLPATYEETKEFRWFQKHFAGEEFILLSWEGCTLDDTQRLPLLTAKLDPGAETPTEHSQHFQSLISGVSVLRQLTEPPIKLSDEEALRRLKGSLIGHDGRQTCIVLALSERGKQKPRKAVEAVLDVAVNQCGIPREKFHMGGPVVDNYALDTAGEKSLARLASLAFGIGLLISWWCLRSKRLVALVFITGTYCAALSMALVHYTGKPYGITMNAILLTMPSLVYVAAISGAIHLSNYYRDTVMEEGLAGAPGRALAHAALPLGLATVTTAVGLVTLCYSELVPIQLFGLYSAIGVVGSLLLLCLSLPAGFQLWPISRSEAAAQLHDVPPSREPDYTRGWWRVADGIVRNHALVTAAGILVLVACGWGITKIETSVQLMRMFPKGATIRNDYAWLEEHLGELVPMEVVLRIDPAHSTLGFLERLELVEKVQQQIETIDKVGSAISAVTFTPKLPKPEDYRNRGGLSGAMTKLLVRDSYATARRVTAKRLEENRDELIKLDYLSEEDGRELWRISARVSATKDVDYGEFVQDIRRQVEPILEECRADGSADIQAVYTGLVPLVYKSQRSLLNNLLFGFGTDLIVVTIVMILAVREWSAGIVLVLPAVFPAVIIFGLMGWMGIIIDTGTVMAPAVALGVTVDDVVHFMLMYRGGLKAGLDRRASLMGAYKTCARAMYQSWGVIGLGLSVFALSPFTPTQRFGYLMVTLLTASLAGNLLVLPAVLAGPLGAFFGRRFLRRHEAAGAHLPPGDFVPAPNFLRPLPAPAANIE